MKELLKTYIVMKMEIVKFVMKNLSATMMEYAILAIKQYYAIAKEIAHLAKTNYP